MNTLIGQPIPRVDGRAKVTGAAQFAAEFSPPRVAHAVVFQSRIAHGTVTRIDRAAAENAAGVLAVITHENAPRLGRPTHFPAGQSLPVLQNAEVFFSGQHLGVVVAETFEQAQYAASLVRIEYKLRAPHIFAERLDTAAPPASGVTVRNTVAEGGRGDIDAGLRQAAKKIEATYTTPLQHHHALEPHATVAWWEGERLHLRDATENFTGTRQILAEVFGLAEEQVVVQSPFTGGSFGSKGQSWPHVIIAALAARAVGRPVKLALTRRQMATSCGHRSPLIQKLALGTDLDGRLIATRHATLMHTSQLDDFVEPTGQHTELLYSCPNVFVSHRLVRAHVGTPTPTRGPGETPGSFALESAMDELAVALRLDPIALRVRNDAARDEHENRPWSSKALKECYALGAEKFGWARRTPEPRSMREGRWLVGYGMAATTLGASFRKAEARGIFYAAEGRLVIQCATHEIGVGNYTILTQIAADGLGVAMERVKIELGDARFPPTPRGGSPAAASVGSAVLTVARELRQRLLLLAVSDQASPLRALKPAALAVENGRVFVKDEPARGESFTDILQRRGLARIEAKAVAQPGVERGEPSSASLVGGVQQRTVAATDPRKKPDAKSEEPPQPGVFSFHSFGAHFCEVRVDPDLGIARVTRWISVIDAGRILNPLTACSQVRGGVIWGLGNALMEETVQDVPTGRFLQSTLADYHLATHADVPEIEVHFIAKDDPHANPLGVKSIGEIGNTGSAAAIANAIFHATGQRCRDLPITPEKILT